MKYVLRITVSIFILSFVTMLIIAILQGKGGSINTFPPQPKNEKVKYEENKEMVVLHHLSEANVIVLE